MELRSQQLGPILGALGVLVIIAALLADVIFHVNRSVLLLAGGVGIVLFALFLFMRPREELREAITGRTAVYGTNTFVMAILFIGILTAINYLAGQQLHGRWDLTSNKQFTLSQQTVNVLKDLKDPVQVTGFYTPQAFSQQGDAETELKLYTQQTGQLTYRFVDPVANPAAAKQYNILQDATLVFERGSRQEKVYSTDENSFTNAILKVTQTTQPAIYFTTGHGELGPTDFNQSGLSSIRDYLQQTNYKVDELNLAAITSTQTISGGVPADTSALVIADPQKPFASEDEARLKTYLQNGGRILVMVNPQSDPGLKDLMSSYGLTLTNDLVLDPALNYRGFAPYPVVSNFPSHEVTSNLLGYGVFFPGARSIQSAANNDKNPVALFKTTDQACGKTDLAALKNQQQVQCDPANDEKGPFVLGYAIESTPAGAATTKPSRLIVVGNATFATNQVMQSPDGEGNRRLVVNMINWLAGQENLIAVPAKDPGSHALRATSNQDAAIIALSNVGLIPLAFLFIGGLMWWRRR